MLSSARFRTLLRISKVSYTKIFGLSSNPPNYPPDLLLEPKFTNTEQEKILRILNESNGEQLLGFNVAQTRIKTIESYKKRNGPFKSLEELLEVDGLNVKTLEKICKQIIADKPPQSEKTSNPDLKKLKQALMPPLPSSIKENISSVVGIHITPVGVSWAKLIKSNNKLLSWGDQSFENLPKKMYTTDTFHLAIHLLTKIPSADVYVFEGTNGIGMQGQKQAAVTTYTFNLELNSMLVALLNTSSSHNVHFSEDSEDVTNQVYFLRAKLPARLFKTLVGNECVSNTSTVLELFDNSKFNLPCTPVLVEDELKNQYLSDSSTVKELLGQALLLTAAFTDVCVRHNSASIKAVVPGKRST